VPDSYMGSYDLTNPQSMNRYAYALNNPVSFTDPKGQECVWDDGSFDSADDPDTGDAGGCSQAGGTFVPPDIFENSVDIGGKWNSNYGDWSSNPNLNLANSWTNPSVTANSGPFTDLDATIETGFVIDAVGLTYGAAPNNGNYVSVLSPKPTVKQKILNFVCKNSPQNRVIASMEFGFANGAIRGGIAGATGGVFFEGVGAVPGAILGGFVGGIAGTAGGVITGGAAAGACSLGGAY
jgi:hypothetical protein